MLVIYQNCSTARRSTVTHPGSNHVTKSRTHNLFITSPTS